MSLNALPIVLYPDPVLRRVAEEITRIDAEVTDLAGSMIATMVECGGVGLAGPQVGVSRRILVVSVTGQAEDAVVFVNPRVVEFGSEEVGFDEGCLSFPDIRGIVVRPEQVTVESLDLAGEEVRTEADGLLARALQHEIDHLNGKLFVTMFGPADQLDNRRRLKRLEKEYRAPEDRR